MGVAISRRTFCFLWKKKIHSIHSSSWSFKFQNHPKTYDVWLFPPKYVQDESTCEQCSKPWLVVWYRLYVILPNFMGILIRQYKDPYKPISLMECHKGLQPRKQPWGGGCIAGASYAWSLGSKKNRHVWWSLGSIITVNHTRWAPYQL